MKLLLLCLLLVFTRTSFADTFNGSSTIDLLSWRSVAAIKPRATRKHDYKLVMARHSIVISKNSSFLSFRDLFLEGLVDPENGSRPARIRSGFHPPDRDVYDVRGTSEPSALAILGTGLLGLAVLVKRRTKDKELSGKSRINQSVMTLSKLSGSRHMSPCVVAAPSAKS